MKRIVDTITFLGKQGLAFRGHRRRLNQPVLNTGNLLEALKYLPNMMQQQIDIWKKQDLGRKTLTQAKAKKRGAKGRGSKLTFLSKNSQNAVINIIGER